MEEYYIKKNGKYIPAGYSIPNMPYGFYFYQKQEHGSRKTSINYWAGNNPPQPLDVEKLVSIMSQDEKLSKFIMALTDENSEEFKKAKEDSGGFVRNPLVFYNFSGMDLAASILRFMFHEIEKEKLNDPV